MITTRKGYPINLHRKYQRVQLIHMRSKSNTSIYMSSIHVGTREPTSH